MEIEKLRKTLREADAVVVGAGAGLSTTAGFTYSGERFQQHFADFIRQYGFTDMYSAGFYPFPTEEENGPTGAAISTTTATCPPRSPSMTTCSNC